MALTSCWQSSDVGGSCPSSLQMFVQISPQTLVAVELGAAADAVVVTVTTSVAVVLCTTVVTSVAVVVAVAVAVVVSVAVAVVTSVAVAVVAETLTDTETEVTVLVRVAVVALVTVVVFGFEQSGWGKNHQRMPSSQPQKPSSSLHACAALRGELVLAEATQESFDSSIVWLPNTNEEAATRVGSTPELQRVSESEFDACRATSTRHVRETSHWEDGTE